MKRCAALLALLTILCSCSLISGRTPVSPVTWPEKITYVAAYCELDVRWKDQTFSGTMTLKMDYPDHLFIEIYGPFGETEVVMTKEKDKFLLVTGEERVTDPRRFENIFGISLADFMEDLATKGAAARSDYRVISRLDTDRQEMIWYGTAGMITLKVLEAKFTP